MSYQLSGSVPCWVATRSCGCERKSYLILPHGFILWVKYIDRDEYSIDIYVGSNPVYGEVVHAIDMCEAREKAMCTLGSFIGRLLHSVSGVNPRYSKSEAIE